MGYRLRLSFTAIILALGASFQIGYFSVLYNVPQDVVEDFVNQSFARIWNYTLPHSDLTWMWSSIVSANMAGKFISCLMVPIFADRFGRRNSLILWSIPGAASILLQSLAYPTDLFHLLALGRFLHGFYGGIVGVLVPLFFAEIVSTSAWRGALSRIHTVVTVFGGLVGIVVGLPQILGTDHLWPYLPAVPLVLMATATVWLFFVPESPLHLMTKGRPHKEILKSMLFYSGQVSMEQKDAVRKILVDAPSTTWTLFNALKGRQTRKLIFLWLNLALLATFAGGSLSQNYSTAMLSGFHGFTLFAKYSTVMTAVVRLLIVVFVMHLMDKLGRKFLLLSCAYATLFCYILLLIFAMLSERISDQSLLYLRLPFFLVWTGSSYGVFSTSSLIVAETAPQHMRATALALYKIVFYLLGVVLTVSYPHYAEIREEYGYILVGCPFLVGLIYLTVVCPETKNLTMLAFDQEDTDTSEQTLTLKNAETVQETA